MATTQTLTGTVKSLSADGAGGIMSAEPAYYPQAVNGVLLSSEPEIGTIDATAGTFTLTLPKGADIALTGRDGRGRVFFSMNLTVSSADASDLSSYLT